MTLAITVAILVSRPDMAPVEPVVVLLVLDGASRPVVHA
jgi:hypothetical protein